MATLISIKSLGTTGNMKTVENGLIGSFNSSINLCGDFEKENNPGLDNPAFEDAQDNQTSESTNKDEESAGEEKKDKLEKPVPTDFLHKYGGMAFTFLASMLISCVTLIVKILHTVYDTNAEDASFWRWAGIMIPSIPLLCYYEKCRPRSKKKSSSIFDTVWPIKEHWRTVLGLLCRGILGGFSVIFRYFALDYLTIGDASVISYSGPILVTILAHFFLGEKTGVVPILSALLALCGVVVITQPPILTGRDGFDHGTLIGTGFACGSLVCSALMTILTRKIRKVQFSIMMFAFGIIGLIQSYIISMVHGTGLTAPRGSSEFLLLLGISLLSFAGQMSIILGLKFEQAGPVALIRTCDVVFGFILQFIVLGVSPNVYSAVGGSIVFCGILITALRKYLSTLPLEHWCRRCLWFLLY